MYNLEDRSDLDYFTVSFRCYVKHARLVNEAAKKAGTNPAEYARKVVLDWAASDLGVPAPDYSPLPSLSKAVKEAAKAQGVSEEEYRRLALARALEYDLARGKVENVVMGTSRAVERSKQAIRRSETQLRAAR
jgi:hypothetical protein